MTTTTKTATVTETNIEKYLAAREEVSFKYNKAGAKMWYHARAIIGTGAFNYGKFAGWSVDHDVKINRNEAASYLKKYGLTVEQFVAAEKEFYAIRYPKDETTAEDNVEVEDTTTEAEENTAQVEYKPQTAWENPHDFTTVGNLNGQPRQYVNPEAIAAPKGFWANRINGTFTTWINGEYVSFENHSIAYIDAEKKLGFHYKKSDAGRKIFYRGNQRFAASKIVEAYMNGQKASEQNKAHHEFFDAHKTAYNKFFQAYFKVTTADGRIHNFERTFDSFDDAKALVDKFTATFSEPADILIKRNGRLAPVYYTRTDGLPGTYTMFYFGEDGFDPEVFNLLPALDTLNDVDDDEPADEDPDDDDPDDDADNDSAEDNVETEDATEPREGDWEISNKLTRKLNRNVRLSNYTEVITQDGERTFVNFGAPHVEPDGNTDHGFAFVHYDTTLGRYDTREQAETVINRITATVERGEEKFIFPTVEELTAPKDFTAKLAKLEAERDVAQKNVDEKQAVLIKAQAEHEKAVETWRESNCAIDRLYRAEVQSLSEKLLPLNIAAVKVTKQDGYTDYVYAETLVIRCAEDKFIIRGDCSIKKYCLLAKYDTPEQVTRVINGLKAATEHETKFKFPTVEELNQPSKDDLRGSLKRAAEVFSATVTGGRPIYCREQTTPTGTYHWANPKGDNPPTLAKITQTRWYEAEWSLFNGERKRVIRGEHVTVWKHGWHHIKGARKVKK